MARDNFSRRVADALAKRAAYICSNPDCRVSTVAPSKENDGYFVYIGKAAHICGAAAGGPRYDPKLTAEQRKSAPNGLFLCSSCADMIDKNHGLDFSVEQLRAWKADHDSQVAANLNRSGGRGGDGGGGTIKGNRGIVIGGRGGSGGVGGNGGRGGGGDIVGDDALIIGGDSGNSGSFDGRGGRGARGPTERFGFPSDSWGYGRGGSGGNHPEYDRRIQLLRIIREEYLAKFLEDARYIEAGVEQVPIDWINQRLSEQGELWKVAIGPNGYVLPSL